jgi:RND family efflux transporter MFP subunit
LKRPKKGTWIVILIALLGCATTVLLLAQDEEDSLAQIERAPLGVETMRVVHTSYRVRIPAWGLVEPCETIEIRTQIAGKVAWVPPTVFAGAAVAPEMLLCLIDDRDYRNALAQAVAAREQAQQALEIEMGRQSIARAEWRLLDNAKWEPFSHKALALREPQLKACQADIRLAAVKQAQAELDVTRTRLTAPCSGIILDESLAAGQVLDAGDVVMRIACTARYHLMVAFAPDHRVDPQQKEAAITIGAYKTIGEVKSVLPQTDATTRHNQALVVFTAQGVPLGAYACVHLPGPFFEGVAVLPAEALRPESTVWLVSREGTLERRPVAVLGRDDTHIVIGEGLSDGDEVVLSHIASPLEGMALKTKEQHTPNRIRKDIP